jgi:hypothetical protein
MNATKSITMIVALVSLITPVIGAAPSGNVTTFPVQRVQSFLGTNVSIFPEEEHQRQFGYENARLYGVASLPRDDPYGGAWSTLIAKIMRPPMVAQVWGEPGRRVTRLAGYVDGKWSDLNAQIVREGGALALQEGQSTPYRAQALEAQRAAVGRYAYRHVAWFWTNSRAMYALTTHPAQGMRVPVAIAMVGMTRIEAGYLTGSSVSLLPTGSLRLGSTVVAVSSRGPDLTLVMKSLGGMRTQTFRWKWDGKAYRLVEATEH